MQDINTVQNSMPEQSTNNESGGKSMISFKRILLVGSIIAFLAIVILTIILYLQNRNALNINNNEEQSSDISYDCSKVYTSLEEALENPLSVCELDLSDQNLSELSPDILQLVLLRRLRLNDNNFTTIPPEVFELTNLVELNLERNNIQEVPEGLRNLVNLKVLALFENDIDYINPEYISGITGLILFGVNDNNLTEENIQQLKENTSAVIISASSQNVSEENSEEVTE